MELDQELVARMVLRRIGGSPYGAHDMLNWKEFDDHAPYSVEERNAYDSAVFHGYRTYWRNKK